MIDQFDRLPPHAIDAEMSLLASVMLDKDVYLECKPLVSRASFYQPDNGIIWQAIAGLYDTGKPVDAIILRDSLKTQGIYEEVGGNDYLGQILGTVPSATHGRYYAGIVVEKHKWRELIRVCNDTIRAGYTPHQLSNADEQAAKLELAAGSVRDTGHADTIRTIGEIVDEVLEHKKSNRITRQASGIGRLDELCGGFPIGGMTIIAGGAGMGKSQLVKQILLNLASGGTPCGLISIEETGEKIGENMLSNQSGVANSSIVYNRLSREELAKLSTAAGKLGSMPWYIDDAQMRLSAIEASARLMVKKHGCKVVAIDHQHLIVADGGAARDSREQELSQISGHLKTLFKSLGVAGIVASQVNRGATVDEETRPEARHLRGSGTLEQDGDLILMLHRPDYYRWKRDKNFTPNHQFFVFVDKNKGGPVGQAELYFDGDVQFIGDPVTNDPWSNQ